MYLFGRGREKKWGGGGGRKEEEEEEEEGGGGGGGEKEGWEREEEEKRKYFRNGILLKGIWSTSLNGLDLYLDWILCVTNQVYEYQ